MTPASEHRDVTPLEWLESLQYAGIRPGLSRMRSLLRALGRPERVIPAIIVAGTNGKGSTSATLASILRTSGYRTGFYSSPHLVDLRERWMIDGSPILPELLDASIAAVRLAGERTGILPTYFEALTLIAFFAFREAACELTVLEVGMGGRLDATNVVRPLASVITPIGLDHTEYLGNTIRRIAREKAGVIHRGAVALTSNRDPVVLDVLRRRASSFGIRLHVMSEETGSNATASEDPSMLELRTPRDRYRLRLPLIGEHQRDNITLAVRTAEELTAVLPRISRDAIVSGVESTRWRGRLERFDAGGKVIWVDGAHNAHAIRRIAEFVSANLSRPRLLIFGIMADKDVDDFTRIIVPLFDRVIATEPYRPRCVAATTLRDAAIALGVPAEAEAEPDDALRLALAGPEPVVLVCGSLYLAGAAVAFFDRRRALIEAAASSRSDTAQSQPRS